MRVSVLVCVLCALLALVVVQAAPIEWSQPVDAASLAETEAQVVVEHSAASEAHAERPHDVVMVHPIVDNTGSQSEAPRANLTRFRIRPKIDSKAFVHDAELANPTAPAPTVPITPSIAVPAFAPIVPIVPTVPIVPIVPAAAAPLIPAFAPVVTPAGVVSVPAAAAVHAEPAPPAIYVGPAVMTPLAPAAPAAVAPAMSDSAIPLPPPVTEASQAAANLVAYANKVSDFSSWTVKYKKDYTVEESAARAVIFEQNRAKIALSNAVADTFFHIDGPFADLTDEEFATQFLTARPIEASGARSLLEAGFQSSVERRPGEIFFETESDLEALSDNELRVLAETSSSNRAHALESNVDWRQFTTPIKSSRTCGASWAHVAAEVLESSWAIAGKGLRVLSPQQLIDCNREGQYQCHGGNYMNSFAYWKSHGSTSRFRYPYVGVQENCRAASGNGPRVRATGMAIPQCMGGSCPEQDNHERDLVSALAKYGPLAVMVDGSRLQHYTAGIMSHKSGCSGDWSKLNHAATLVGYNAQDQSFLLRSSWSSSWGEQGYFRLAFGGNSCGVSNYVGYVQV